MQCKRYKQYVHARYLTEIEHQCTEKNCLPIFVAHLMGLEEMPDNCYW
jgi:hypothetical protein